MSPTAPPFPPPLPTVPFVLVQLEEPLGLSHTTAGLARSLPVAGLHLPQGLAAAAPTVYEESIGEVAAPREAYRLQVPCSGAGNRSTQGREGGA